MSKVCAVCGKAKVSGHNVTHSNKHNKRTWAPNLRRVKAVVNGTPRTIRVCTRCLRSGKVTRSV